MAPNSLSAGRMHQHVPLDPDSLYVCTVQLATGAFHWAIIITDANSRAVRHHWYQVSGRPYAETYGSQTVTPATRTGNSAVLGYYKLEGYVPCRDFIDICRSVFTSYATVDENRAHNMTCRTWILQVLMGLYDKGSFPGRKENRSEFISLVETKIKTMSTQADNNFLTLFYQSLVHQYHPPVLSL
ncbi:hypothetical protein DFS33DRAFT_729628 [Desarmillaria ectypa]|uniref:Uncharacterized protein n=1 Tax=Armillaria tabescens TaxID=1929756 RepID=A0AA39TT97_ARMTA|nr:uncharacterized protein EV420DRAFT_36230 [Desarmillaria tabescens]KAK0205065.1 hypothetical protein DFS33DRAFT_729628 [Desarmillaria ectypa]KAK0469482.1 hypothetical protein EV420DRAFT_36230 [Desarmillaria tabescens]